MTMKNYLSELDATNGVFTVHEESHAGARVYRVRDPLGRPWLTCGTRQEAEEEAQAQSEGVALCRS